jgi:site-specific recombinase XerD
VERAGIKHLTFHEMRHTFASHLVMNGTDLPSIQALMGYADIKTTMRYSHLAPEHLHRAVHKLYWVPSSDDEELT